MRVSAFFLFCPTGRHSAVYFQKFHPAHVGGIGGEGPEAEGRRLRLGSTAEQRCRQSIYHEWTMKTWDELCLGCGHGNWFQSWVERVGVAASPP